MSHYFSRPLSLILVFVCCIDPIFSLEEDEKPKSRSNRKSRKDAVSSEKDASVSLPRLKPAPLESDKEEVLLPSPATTVCVGGGGRFIFLHIPEEKKLAVFDVQEARIVKYLPAAEAGIRFAAGLDKVFIANPNSGALQRYSLATFQREVTVKTPGDNRVELLLIGWNTKGPLFVSTTAGLAAIDPETFKHLPLNWTDSDGRKQDGPPFSFVDVAPEIRISADGRTITGWNVGRPSAGTIYRKLDTKSFQGASHHDTARYLLPSPDSKIVYSSGHRYTRSFQAIGKDASRHGKAVWFVPAVQGGYYLAVRQIGRSDLGISISIQGHDEAILNLPDVEGLTGFMDNNSGETLPFDKHLFYFPDANLLAVLPAAKDRLVLHRVDIIRKLDEAEIDYLIVTSQPPTEFKPGSTLKYQIDAKSKQGGISYTLESAPDGMELSPDGLVTWDIPASVKDAEINVIITIKDSTEQEIFHNLKLTNVSSGGDE